MKYDITKQTAPKMPRLGKGTECVKILLSLSFNILTSHGRNCVDKWQISLQKVGVTRGNCHF